MNLVNTEQNLYKGNQKLKMDPIALNNIGKQIIDESIGFGQNVKQIYENVDEMARSNYQSADAIVLANKIKNYQQYLMNLTKTIENYGIHCQRASKIMIETQESISNGIR